MGEKVKQNSNAIVQVRRARNQKQVVWRLHYAKPEVYDGHTCLGGDGFYAQVWANTLQDAVREYLRVNPTHVLFNAECERW